VSQCFHLQNVADSLWLLFLFGYGKSFGSFDNSSMLELCNRMQLDSRDVLMTTPTRSGGAAGGRLAMPVRSPAGILRVAAGAAVILLASCSHVDQSRHDWAKELVPADSFSIQSTAWVIETWSARKRCTFESRMSPAEYRSWVERKLGEKWHRRLATDSGSAYVRLTPTEQQVLEIGLEITPQALHVQVTFTAMPT
jgi:hypothetical protein